jgi:hypothetical protein
MGSRWLARVEPAVVATVRPPDPGEDRVTLVAQLATAAPVLIVERAARDRAVSVKELRARIVHADNRTGRVARSDRRSYGAASKLSANVHSGAGYSARSTGSTVAQFSGVNASIGRKSAERSS